MITLTIVKNGWRKRFELLDQEGEVLIQVPYGEVSGRPDPIRRAWAAVEAKRGMAHG